MLVLGWYFTKILQLLEAALALDSLVPGSRVVMHDYKAFMASSLVTLFPPEWYSGARR